MGFYFYVFSGILRALSVFVTQVIAVRALNLDAYGEAIYLTSLVVYAQSFTGMMIGEKVSFAIASSKYKGWEDIKGLLPILRLKELKLILVTSLVLIVSLFLLTLQRSFAFSPYLVLSLLPTTFGYQTFLNSFIGNHEQNTVSVLYILEAIIAPIVMYVVTTIDSSPGAFIVATGLKSSFIAIVAYLVLFRKVRDMEVSQSLISTKMAFQNRSLLLKSIWSNLDTFVVGMISGSRFAGEYRIAKSLVSIPSLLAQPVWMWKRPALQASVRTQSWLEVKYTVLRLSSILAFFAGVGLVLCFFWIELVVATTYDIQPSYGFLTMFVFMYFAFVSANTVTAWSRFLAAILNKLKVSQGANLVLVIVLALSPVVDRVLGVPIPITISCGLFFVTVYWWHWFAKYLDKLISDITQDGEN